MERLERSPLGLRLARGAFWGLMGGITARGFGLCASILVARMLGRVGYGELGIVQATVGMFGTFAAFGVGLTATKYVGELRRRDPARAGGIVALSSAMAWLAGGLMCCVVLVVAPWLATHTLAAPHLGRILRISSLLLLTGAVDGAQTGALAGFEAFRRIARVNLLAGAATFPLMVGGAWWLGLDGAVIGLVASQATSTLLSYRALRAEAAASSIQVSWTTTGKEWRVLFAFSLPAFTSSVLVGPVYWLCTARLVNQADGYTQMGLFNAANQWFGALLFLPGVLGQAALPIMSEHSRHGDRARLRTILAFYVRLSGLVVLPLVLCGAIASPYVMAWYGPAFREAWPTLIVVLVTAGLLAVLNPVGQVIAALGRMWAGTLMNLGWAASFLLLTFLLVPWGALGLAWARLTAYLLHAVWTLAFARVLLARDWRAS